uniref:Ig-like domain-containing protein n=1 Tax=Poecilia reticulata TaxID=8081 RepID=A0A3P9PH04_POERE
MLNSKFCIALFVLCDLFQLGQPVTVTCVLSEALQSVSWLYWYKQSAGDTLKLVSMLRKNTNPTYGPGFSASRFNTTYDDKISNLTILKASTEDEGMYHCAYLNWLQTMWSGAYLSLKETRRTSNYKVVQQPAVSHSANPADSVSLQCSFLSDSDQKPCSEEPSMFWIRAGSDKPYPDLIYTEGKSSRTCEKRAGIQKRCIYNFSMKASSSDVGTYYCAVATCGEILFGNGANLNIQGKSFLLNNLNPLYVYLEQHFKTLCRVLV